MNGNARTAIKKLPDDFEADAAARAGDDNIAVFEKLWIKHAMALPASAFTRRLRNFRFNI
jgi:hypothetical protein